MTRFTAGEFGWGRQPIPTGIRRSTTRTTSPITTWRQGSMSLQSSNLRRQRASLGGFTLLEMMIVIAIMLLLVIATLPRLKQALDESKVRESSRQLSSHFSLAKARAASTGRPCGLWFVPEFIGDPTATPV